MRDRRRPWTRLGRLGAPLALVILVAAAAGADAQARPRIVLVVPFDAASLPADERWIGEGVAQVVRLGLAQHPAFVQVDQARLRSIGQPDAWGDAAVVQAAKTVRADHAIFGEPRRRRDDDPAEDRRGEDGRGAGHGAGLGAVGRAADPAAGPRHRLRPHAQGADDGGRGGPDREGGAAHQVDEGVRAVRAQPGRRAAGGPGGQRVGRRPAVARHRGRPELRGRAVHARHRAPGPRRPRSSALPRSSTRRTRSPTRRWATCSWPRRGACSTRPSRRTPRPSSCGRSTPRPTSGSARRRPPRATSTGRSPPTRRRSPTTRSTPGCT